MEKSQSEKLYELYLQQKQTLDVFLEHKAISKEQYDKSLNGLKEKVNIDIKDE